VFVFIVLKKKIIFTKDIVFPELVVELICPQKIQAIIKNVG